MQSKSFEIRGPILLFPEKIEDARGFFSEVYNAKSFASIVGETHFVQDNFSLSKDVGIIRGLNFQAPPFEQGKLVRVTHGAVFDVAVDIRRS